MEGFLLPTPDNLLTIVLCFDISVSFRHPFVIFIPSPPFLVTHLCKSVLLVSTKRCICPDWVVV